MRKKNSGPKHQEEPRQELPEIEPMGSSATMRSIFIDRIDYIKGIIYYVVPSLYVAGYAVSSLHYYSNGYTNLPLLKPEYLFAGLLFAVITAANFAILTYFAVHVLLLQRRSSLRQVATLIVVGFFVCYLYFFGVPLALDGVMGSTLLLNEDPFLWSFPAYFSWCLIMYLTFDMLSNTLRSVMPNLNRFQLFYFDTLSISYILMVFIILSVAYSQTVFPNLPLSLAGGQTVRATIEFKETKWKPPYIISGTEYHIVLRTDKHLLIKPVDLYTKKKSKTDKTMFIGDELIEVSISDIYSIRYKRTSDDKSQQIPI